MDTTRVQAKNIKRKKQKSSGKDARITQAGLSSQVGANGPEMVVDNTKSASTGDHQTEDLGVVTDLDFDGWSSE